ncbi:hypothetical protein [Rhodanobacter sp. BL-MT-08]
MLITIVILVVVGAIGISAHVYIGIYKIGADDPHTRPVFTLLQTLRKRSIAIRGGRVPVPDLQDAALIRPKAPASTRRCARSGIPAAPASVAAPAFKSRHHRH